MTSIGSQIRKRRRQAGLSQQALAHKAKVSIPTLRKVEANGSTIGSVQSVCLALGCSIQPSPIWSPIGFGFQLAYLRKKQGLSQRDVAGLIFVSPPSIVAMEKANSGGSYLTVAKCLSLYGGGLWLVPIPFLSRPHKFTFVDLFAGIGGFHLALSGLGGECLLFSEINRFSQRTYKLNFGDKIALVDDVADIDAKAIAGVDVLCAGFPCQSFSIVGKQQGLLDNRGGLIGVMLRVIKIAKPRILILENVPHLLTIDDGNTFKGIVKCLKSFGYNISHAVLNSFDHSNIPQNRNRLFIVGFRDKKLSEKFRFFEAIKPTTDFSYFLDSEALPYDGRLTIKGQTSPELSQDKPQTRLYQFLYGEIRAGQAGICPTLTAQKSSLPKVKIGGGVRDLSVRECARLQGFPDRFLFPETDNQTFQQIGNSVNPILVSRIAQHIESIGGFA